MKKKASKKVVKKAPAKKAKPKKKTAKTTSSKKITANAVTAKALPVSTSEPPPDDAQPIVFETPIPKPNGVYEIKFNVKHAKALVRHYAFSSYKKSALGTIVELDTAVEKRSKDEKNATLILTPKSTNAVKATVADEEIVITVLTKKTITLNTQP